MLPISLYIHIPFCVSKCSYCSFLSFTNYKYLNINKYIISMLKNLKEDFIFKNDSRYISSIYLGGGTPSLLDIKNINFLIENIILNFPCKKNLEITLEANILDLNLYNIFHYYKLGINRLSLGVQSFDNNILRIIKRNYTLNDILRVIDYVSCYFNNFSIDLIYGLPNQSISSVLKDINNVISFNIPHLSWYELSIEKNTKYYNILNKNLDYSKIHKMYFLGKKILKENGYFQYEISSYARNKNFFCFHNINYWYFGDYLSIGCGSHSKITFLNFKSIYRITKNFDFNLYINNLYIKKKYILSVKDIISEYFICRLRLLFPLYIKDFSFYTGLKFKLIKNKIKLAIKRKYLIYKNNKKFLCLTPKGILFLNDCLKIFC